MFTWLCKVWFKWAGWKCMGTVPPGLDKYVMVVAPHTSNVDFFVGVAARDILNLDVKYLAKKELFQFPIRKLLLRLGGYPVDRSQNTSLVDQVVAIFNGKNKFAICVTPEGTRSRVAKFRSGFYHIAVQAGVPIVMVGFDYAKKQVLVADPFSPSGDYEADLQQLKLFYNGITPRHPEKSHFHR